MAVIDKKYNILLKEILAKGFRYEDPNRKGVHRIQIPSYTFVHNFKDGFPALTTKKLYWKGVVTELLWFLKGDTSTKFLIENGVNIWNKDGLGYINRGDEEELDLKGYVENVKNGTLDGDLGRVYGVQWRDFRGINECKKDQIQELIIGLKKSPLGTRHLVSTWNAAEIHDAALPPCHWGFEVLVEPMSIQDKNIYLSEKGATWNVNSDMSKVYKKWNVPNFQFTLKWHQRSVDTFLGLPFNIASYALLAEIIGSLTNMKPKSLVGDLSNVHIYEPHLDSVAEQLSRNKDKYWKPLSLLPISGFKMDMNLNIDNWLNSKEVKDFKIKDYESFDAIKAEMLPYNK